MKVIDSVIVWGFDEHVSCVVSFDWWPSNVKSTAELLGELYSNNPRCNYSLMVARSDHGNRSEALTFLAFSFCDTHLTDTLVAKDKLLCVRVYSLVEVEQKFFINFEGEAQISVKRTCKASFPYNFVANSNLETCRRALWDTFPCLKPIYTEAKKQTMWQCLLSHKNRAERPYQTVTHDVNLCCGEFGSYVVWYRLIRIMELESDEGRFSEDIVLGHVVGRIVTSNPIWSYNICVLQPKFWLRLPIPSEAIVVVARRSNSNGPGNSSSDRGCVFFSISDGGSRLVLKCDGRGGFRDPQAHRSSSEFDADQVTVLISRITDRFPILASKENIPFFDRWE